MQQVRTWNDILTTECQKDYYVRFLAPFLRQEYGKHECYPHKDNIFRAFYATGSPRNVKVVILGQDPYHEPGQAMGLSFSVPEDCPNPPSLQNIILEIKRESQVYPENCELYDGDLTFWAQQGVLLLNTTLTVQRGHANSHKGHWNQFSNSIIKRFGSGNEPIVFMLWGKDAKSKSNLITNPNALVLKTSHPSPFSAKLGFIGCNHFNKCNDYLIQNNLEPINWFGDTEDIFNNGR